MIEANKHKVTQAYIINQQLFSQAYLRELRAAKFSVNDIKACYQTIREWRDEAQNLTDQQVLRQYIGRCLSTLGLSYTSQQTSFTLYGDATLAHPVGICLFTNDEDIGRTTKGRHYQAQLIKQLRDSSLRWGILTNGKRWRLCNVSLAAPYEVFLEVDLDSLLEKALLVEIMLFSFFFGQSAFRIDKPKDNRIAQIRLDSYIKDSEKYTEAIQRYLRGRVESVLQSLCLGFVQDEAADTYTRETLKEIYDNSIYLLYRTLFLFYAEARELLPVHDSGYQLVSLSSIIEETRRYQKEGIQDPDPFSLWKRLTELFVIVDEGRSTLGIRPYNGGLFDDQKRPYLKSHKIANSHLAPALFDLAYMRNKSGTERIKIDYNDLSVRQLGTLYEGLLEYRLNLVTQEPMVVRENKGSRNYTPLSEAGLVKRDETILDINQVYFADDKNERKSSGSYYTPEDVVQYIITNTVLPKLQKRRASLETMLVTLQREAAIAATVEEQRRLERYADDTIIADIEQNILGLRILDPAMGSAHFLVAAGQLMTNFIVETLNLTEWPNNTLSSDPLSWKRRVVERSLYGVDLNPLAHELAKLSLWLSSASTGKPLTFLDHHLKVGNSLYGVPLSRLSTLPTSKKVNKRDLFQVLREQTIQTVIEELGKITSLDSERIENVKYKEEVNHTVKDSTQRLRDIANVWLATLFGLQGKDEKLLSQDEYDTLLANVTRNFAAPAWENFVATTRIFRDARKMAEDETFFHWELEFADAVVDGKCQFDVVIANPPYVDTPSDNQTVKTLYQTAKCGDLYACLFEQSLSFLGTMSSIGMIIPLSVMFSRSFTSLRQLLLSGHLHLFLSSYDNIPDGLFNGGKTSDNTNKENSQRTTVILAQKISEETIVETTDLLRWRHEDRHMLFERMRLTDTTRFSSKENFPRIGNDLSASFWTRLKSTKRTLSELSIKIFSETQRPSSDAIFLTVPRATRYFISATPGPMARNKVLSLSFKNKNDMDLARVLLNSNVFYWYWRAFGDGFLLNVENISTLPIPDEPDEQFIELAARLDAVINECTTYKTFRGEKIPNYNFNKRMDILLDIDDWIVRQVAPDLNLPRDIFAQYKSNSFLRPLDLSGIQAIEENIVEEDV